jgi:rod shape-determining protein MreC
MNLNDAPQQIRWAMFLILAGLAITLTILDTTGNMDRFLNFLRDPITPVLSWTSSQADNIADGVGGPENLQAARMEIDALLAEVDSLRRENEELRAAQGEAQLLSDMFNRARQAPEFSRLTAAVIARDPNLAIRSIIIDKGSADGVRVGMPVEGARGLVGRVYRTANHSAQVVLITDSSSAVPARLGSSRATGILRGGGLGGSMTIDWIDLKYQVNVDEVVLSSGLGGRFPEGIVIGRVIEVDRREADLFQEATVQPAADMDALELVFVITDFQPVDVEIFIEPVGE